MGTGPIIIGYDGSPSSTGAIDETGALLARHEAMVVVVGEPGLGFALVEHDAQAIAIGTDGIGLTDVLMSGSSRGVIQRAQCPVVAVREPRRWSQG